MQPQRTNSNLTWQDSILLPLTSHICGLLWCCDLAIMPTPADFSAQCELPPQHVCVHITQPHAVQHSRTTPQVLVSVSNQFTRWPKRVHPARRWFQHITYSLLQVQPEGRRVVALMHAKRCELYLFVYWHCFYLAHGESACAGFMESGRSMVGLANSTWKMGRRVKELFAYA